MNTKFWALVLPLCLLLSGCGRAVYRFPVIDADGVSAAAVKSGTVFDGKTLVYTESGQVFYSENYAVSEPLTGLILEPPAATVMDAAGFARAQLADGTRVLMIYVDGLGWQQYRGALEDGAIPVLAGLDCAPAAAVYPSITPVNYAAMVTGAAPADTGVAARGIHVIACETVFDNAASLGLRSYIAEGDSQLFDFGCAEVELSPDLNGSGSSDDEIFACAMEQIKNFELMLVHFHGVDDAAHEYGPESDEARAALAQVDVWCGKLLSAWDGAAVLTADHGQHTQDGSGDEAYAQRRGTHGDFAPSDIFVPFITVEKESVK